MLLGFLYELRRRGVPVGTRELLALLQALGAGLHDSSLDGLYHLGRALLVHAEAHLDTFDQAFAAHFRGVAPLSLALTSELLEWLREAARRPQALTDAERALLEALDPKELEALLRQRLAEQRERHDGGNRWIGTGGTSPFGHSGAPREGIRVGGPGGGRSALALAEARGYRGYRDDQVLDVRRLQVALRKLRGFEREGSELELDLDETVRKTAEQLGELEVVTRPPLRPSTRVLLLMDVGGSMDPHALTASRLFSAARKATHIRELRTFYFHNCVYGRVYRDAHLSEPLGIPELLAECPSHHKLILVGDATMAPYELFFRGGGRGFGDPDALEGIAWLERLSRHFRSSAWLNPEPRRGWVHPTVRAIEGLFPMFPLTADGLGRAVDHLRGKARGGRPHP